MSRVKFLRTVIILGILALFVIPSIALAQSDIQISRPLDGATVRETVNIIVPVSSVPAGGFVSYSIDGRFRTASFEKSNDNRNYVYRWDTKEIDPDTNVPMDQRLPHDGKRTVSAQSYDKNGIKFGKSKQITIYVKNNASADMPASGLKLEYRYIPNSTVKYKFRNAIIVKSIQGDTSIAARVGSIFEGKEGVIKRTVEDIVARNTAMIRQRLDGNITVLDGGTPTIDTSFTPKSSYRIEDAQGLVSAVIQSSSPGTVISVDMPKLPTKRVKIGDTWTLKQKVLKDPTSNDFAVFNTVNTLEGLEWEGGYPCAKIKTSFAGDVKIPGTDVIKDTVPVSGETITYFAYRTGKLITSTTTATADITVSSSVASSLTSRTGSSGSGAASMGGMMMPGGMPGMPSMPGGMPGMPTMPGMIGGGMPGMPTMPGMIGGGMPGMPTMPGMTGGTDSTNKQDVNIQLELAYKIQLTR
ncbi:MAG: hypothetical protein ACYC0V_02680 [Armatimonadota bacterium]